MKKIEKSIKQYLKERNWDTLRPADISKSISIEAAELLELFQWRNDTLDDVKKDKEAVEAIKKELADIFIYAFDMAVLLGIDTEKIIMDKLEKIKAKYPAELMRNRTSQDSHANDAYWKIKKEHRMKGIN